MILTKWYNPETYVCRLENGALVTIQSDVDNIHYNYSSTRSPSRWALIIGTNRARTLFADTIMDAVTEAFPYIQEYMKEKLNALDALSRESQELGI